MNNGFQQMWVDIKNLWNHELPGKLKFPAAAEQAVGITWHCPETNKCLLHISVLYSK